jgi:hypothetical protein
MNNLFVPMTSNQQLPESAIGSNQNQNQSQAADAHPSSWYVGYGPSPISKAADAASVKGGRGH